jgi:hypothetical protein
MRYLLSLTFITLLIFPSFASASSCEEDYIHSQMQEDYYGDYPTMNSNIGIFIKVVRWQEVPTDLQDGELLRYDTFEEYIYEGTRGSLNEVQESFNLLRTAIIACTWSAKRLNDIQDGLEERHVLGKVEFLEDIDALYYTLKYGKVKIESYPYVGKH